MSDLNSLVPPGARLYLTSAEGINNGGSIVGEGVNLKTGATPAFQLVPAKDDGQVARPAAKVTLPYSLRMQFLHRKHFRQ
jgi:hypothetical protein